MMIILTLFHLSGVASFGELTHQCRGVVEVLREAAQALGDRREHFGSESTSEIAYRFEATAGDSNTTIMFPAGSSVVRYFLTMKQTPSRHAGWLACERRYKRHTQHRWFVELYSSRYGSSTIKKGTLMALLKSRGLGICGKIPSNARSDLALSRQYAGYEFSQPGTYCRATFIAANAMEVDSVSIESDPSLVFWPSLGRAYPVTEAEKKFLKRQRKVYKGKS